MTYVDMCTASAGFNIDQLYQYSLEIRAQQTQALIGLLDAFKRSDKTGVFNDFGGLIRVAQRLLEIDDGAMARILKVSRPTIGRWVRGDATPHPLTQKSIKAELVKKVSEKLKIVRD